MGSLVACGGSDEEKEATLIGHAKNEAQGCISEPRVIGLSYGGPVSYLEVLVPYYLSLIHI